MYKNTGIQDADYIKTNFLYPAIRIEQYNFPFLHEMNIDMLKTTLYATALPASEILNRYEIDRWTIKNKGGYQRNPDYRRVKSKLLKYLLDEVGSYPTSVLLNIRRKDDITFIEKESISNNVTLGLISLNKRTTFYVVDGQHRLESLKEAYREAIKISSKYAREILNYPLSVSIMNVDRKLEMIYFYIVNSRQKRINVVLSYRIIQFLDKKMKEEDIPTNLKCAIDKIISKSKRWISKAVDIVDYLALCNNSPWYNKIKLAGYAGKYPVNERTFIQSMEGILTQSTFYYMDIDTLSENLIDYWNAIFNIYPNTLKYAKEYTIMAYTGLFTFHNLYPFIYGLILKLDRDPVYKNYFDILRYSLSSYTPEHSDPLFQGAIKEEYWHKKDSPHSIFKGTSKKLVNELTQRIKEKIALTFKQNI